MEAVLLRIAQPFYVTQPAFPDWRQPCMGRLFVVESRENYENNP
jgi:hypothetical protein